MKRAAAGVFTVLILGGPRVYAAPLPTCDSSKRARVDVVLPADFPATIAPFVGLLRAELASRGLDLCPASPSSRPVATAIHAGRVSAAAGTRSARPAAERASLAALGRRAPRRSRASTRTSAGNAVRQANLAARRLRAQGRRSRARPRVERTSASSAGWQGRRAAPGRRAVRRSLATEISVSEALEGRPATPCELDRP
jgi:hypothetical protein